MTTTLAVQQPAFAALAQITAAFGHLPGASISLFSVMPGTVDIGLHDSLSDFEAWREALGIPADAVRFKDLPSGMLLKAECSFAGATVELSGFGPHLAPAEISGDGDQS